MTCRKGRNTTVVASAAMTYTGLTPPGVDMSTSPTSAPGPCQAIRVCCPAAFTASARTAPESTTAQALTC